MTIRRSSIFPALGVAASLLFCNSAAAGIRDDWQALADSVRITGGEASAARIEDVLNELSDEELERVYGGADLSSLANSLRYSGKNYKAMLDNNPALRASLYGAKPFEGANTTKSAGLPGAVGYPTPGWCPFSPDRSNADDLLIAQDVTAAARVALETAKEVFAGVDRVCKQVVVVLGEGGNTSLACIPADIVLAIAEFAVGAAETVVEHIKFCDDAVDAAEIEGSYERAGHIHSDLQTHDADMSLQLTTHDTNIANRLATHDADIKALLAQHDADMKQLLAQHDADIKARLDQVQATVNENQRLIKVTMSRQLELLRLLITPSGLRELNPEVLSCTGPDCPQVSDLICADGSLDWPCKPPK